MALSRTCTTPFTTAQRRENGWTCTTPCTTFCYVVATMPALRFCSPVPPRGQQTCLRRLAPRSRHDSRHALAAARPLRAKVQAVREMGGGERLNPATCAAGGSTEQTEYGRPKDDTRPTAGWQRCMVRPLAAHCGWSAHYAGLNGVCRELGSVILRRCAIPDDQGAITAPWKKLRGI